MKTKQQGGFTLIELVAVIVLLGILSVFSYQFFNFGVISYVDVASRSKTTEQGRFMVDRMSREIVNALPGSVRVLENTDSTIKCLEFLPVTLATGYVSIPTIPASNQIQTIAFTIPAGSASDYLAAVYTNDECLVYGINSSGGTCDRTGDGNIDSADRGWHPISGWAAASSQLTNITLNASVSYLQESPSRRLYIASTPVAFCFHNDGRLKRYSQYAFNYPHDFFTANVPPAGGVLMGEAIDFSESDFTFSAANHIRNGIVQINLTLNNHDGTERFPFNYQVSLHNVP